MSLAFFYFRGECEHLLFNHAVFTDVGYFASRICWNLLEFIPIFTSEMLVCHCLPHTPKAWLRWCCMPNSWEGAIFLMFHALCCWFWPHTYVLTSSVHQTCFENALDFSRCSFASFSCWILWWKQQIIYNDSSIRRSQLGRWTLFISSPVWASVFS